MDLRRKFSNNNNNTVFDIIYFLFHWFVVINSSNFPYFSSYPPPVESFLSYPLKFHLPSAASYGFLFLIEDHITVCVILSPVSPDSGTEAR